MTAFNLGNLFGKKPILPEVRTCKLTHRKFEVTAEEIKSFSRFGLPLPTISSEERIRKQLAYRNERRFFWRDCSHTGQRIFSAYAPTTQFPVVAAEYYNSGDWDPISYGREFDFRRPFFDQLHELWILVPRPASVQAETLTSKAVHNVCKVKDSFFVFDSQRSERCWYSVGLYQCSDCLDCYNLQDCNLCYDCLDCRSSEMLRYSEHCLNCVDSYFLFNCNNCRHSLFCANLENAQYCVFNKQVSKEEYEKALREWQFGSSHMLDSARNKYLEFLSTQAVPHIYADRIDDCSGNYLYGCDHALDSFECNDCENIIHCNRLRGAKRCLEGFAYGGETGDCAQFVDVGERAYEVVNSVSCLNDVLNLDYCGYCEDSSNLFGCVGLRGKEYCILNRQFSKGEYRKLRARIERFLRETSIWGYFFPGNFSDFAYNHSAANDYMPLNEVQARMMGFLWDETDESIKPSQLLAAEGDAPDTRFVDTPRTVEEAATLNLKEVLFLCEMTGRPYQLFAEELQLYRKIIVPPPSRGYEQRYRERIARLAPRRMNMRKSSRSRDEIRTAFPENWRQPVLKMSEWQDLVRQNSSFTTSR